MITIGGNVCVRNGDELDYCYRQAIQSLLPICDEVVVCVAPGTDDTEKVVREMALSDKRIKVCIYDWPNPKGNPDFWVEWLNYARQHINCSYHLQIDADEILGEESYPTLQAIKDKYHIPSSSFWAHRLNFWRDHKNTIPPGVCLGHRVIRLAPRSVWLPSDGVHPNGVEATMMAIEPPGPFKIYHYGFLRKPGAFFKKARALQEFFFNSYDGRLAAVEGDPAWMLRVPDVDWIDRLIPYSGGHPHVIRNWLKERGYE